MFEKFVHVHIFLVNFTFSYFPKVDLFWFIFESIYERILFRKTLTILVIYA